MKLPFLKIWLYDLMNSDEFSSVMEKFDLWDPEMAGNGLGYPPQRVFNLGVQLKF
jgi:hypothetical protein